MLWIMISMQISHINSWVHSEWDPLFFTYYSVNQHYAKIKHHIYRWSFWVFYCVSLYHLKWYWRVCVCVCVCVCVAASSEVILTSVCVWLSVISHLSSVTSVSVSSDGDAGHAGGVRSCWCEGNTPAVHHAPWWSDSDHHHHHWDTLLKWFFKGP